MREITGNIWKFFPDNLIVIPTSGSVEKDGSVIMRGGLALQARNRFPDLPYALGLKILKSGNKVYEMTWRLVSFPVKHEWNGEADLNLIKQSTKQLMKLSKDLVYLPEVGCGDGERTWEEVKPILKKLPNNFIVVHYAPTRPRRNKVS